ncbi:AI-2E family transporter [Coprobacillaceae bacterium CR2/5/TPMF4]|nr:AI-2E family transporter [Coprobacillaceae bacterium CR2/5/TPMF4]
MFVVITSLFILLDYDLFEKYVLNKYPVTSLVVDTVKNVLSNIFKASVIIMIVTFVELYLGFVLIGLSQSAMLACIIAVIDFLPVLGLDMIMVPWIIINALTNNIYLAIALLIIYLIVVVTKNILEPRLLAKNLGLSPIVSLIGMYLGMQWFGIIGLFIAPTLIMIIIQVFKVKHQLKIMNS